MHRLLLFAVVAIAAGPAAAQNAAPPAPTDPAAQVPRLEYHSAFDGYEPFAEVKVMPWRESNQVVNADAGNERPAAQEPTQPKSATKPAMGAKHGDHR